MQMSGRVVPLYPVKCLFFFNCDFGAGDQQEMPMECDKSLPAESVFAVAPVQNVGSV